MGLPHGSAVFFIAWPERRCAHARFSEGLACYVGARAALFAARGFLPMSPEELLASNLAGVLRAALWTGAAAGGPHTMRVCDR